MAFLLRHSHAGNVILSKLTAVPSPLPLDHSHAHDIIYKLEDEDEDEEVDSEAAKSLITVKRTPVDSKSESSSRTIDTSRKMPFIPPEVVHAILQRVERGTYGVSGRIADLKNAALVCKLWTDPARRVLFSQPVHINGGLESVVRLCEIFVRFPEWGRAVRTLHLEPSSKRVFTKVSSLLRLTPMVSEIFIKHFALGDKSRVRLFKALETIQPLRAEFTWKPHDEIQWGIGPRVSVIEANIRSLSRLLVEWKTLESLVLRSYRDFDRDPATWRFHCPGRPSYLLAELDLNNVALEGVTLLNLLGTNPVKLTSLNLKSSPGISNDALRDAFELSSSTLEDFLFSHEEEVDGDEEGGPFEPEIFEPLVKLRRCTILSERAFQDDVLLTISALPSIEYIAITLPRIEYPTATMALDNGHETLVELCLDTWDLPVSLWEEGLRWAFAKRCKGFAVEFALNGMNYDEIKDEWFGIDVSKDWRILERSSLPCKTLGAKA